jgi:hypothetical protein
MISDAQRKVLAPLYKGVRKIIHILDTAHPYFIYTQGAGLSSPKESVVQSLIDKGLIVIEPERTIEGKQEVYSISEAGKMEFKTKH